MDGERVEVLTSLEEPGSRRGILERGARALDPGERALRRRERRLVVAEPGVRPREDTVGVADLVREPGALRLRACGERELQCLGRTVEL